MASKKDFDKEYIFNLIMPTNAAADAEAQLPDMPLPADGAAPPADETAQDSLSVLNDRISKAVASNSVKLPAAKNLVLTNLMEKLVAERLDAAFEKFKCCRCDKCRQDVAAIALNSLTPHYVVAIPEDIPDLVAQQDTREVSGALVKAIIQVKNNPQH